MTDERVGRSVTGGVEPEYSHLFTNSSFKENVYPPSEDSFLLLDSVLADVASYLPPPGAPLTVLELGAGSGFVLAGVAMGIGEDAAAPPAYIAVDVNSVALEATRTTWDASGLPADSLQCVQADARQDLAPEVGQLAHVLLFNPPYVPTPTEEIASDGIVASWAGGIRGREVLDQALPHWLSLLVPDGVAYLLLLAENDPPEVQSMLSALGYDSTTIASTQAGIESLSILRIVAQALSTSPSSS